MTNTQATEIRPSDIVIFTGDAYKVRSVIVRSDRVEIAFHDTNDEQPYTYELDDTFTRI